MKKMFRLFLTGFSMGGADIIPGVSGGTIAFILGIYEELIYSIKKLSGETLRLILKGKVKEALKSIPFSFLLPLGLGLFTALITLAKLITHLLDSFPVLVWSFFFGLILSSIWIVKNRVVTWNKHDIIGFILSSVGAFLLVGAVPVETPSNPVAYFLAGFIAIIAMILPGISGSFLLVLMGKYEQILNAVVTFDILTLGLVAAGAVIGLSLFSRVLSWLFAKHHDIAIAVLTGFMLGSLRKVWPWKEVLSTRINSHGEVVPLMEKNILPQLNVEFIFALGLMIAGAALLIILEKMQATREQLSDIEDPTFVTEHKKAVKSQMDGRI